MKVKLQVYKSVLNKFYYFGLRNVCPFCRSHLRMLLPTGRKHQVLDVKDIVGGCYRQQARCPVCNSLDRERLVYLYLQKKTDIFVKPKKVLHVAPSNKLEHVLRSQKHLDYLTADLHSVSVMEKMDITAIQYPENTFDVIICNHVLEHILDDKKAMSELFRVLRPKGFAILQVPIALSLLETYEDQSLSTPLERKNAFGSPEHVRIYSKNDYVKKLEQVGFTVHQFHWLNEIVDFGGHKNKYGLNKDELLFSAYKY